MTRLKKSLKRTGTSERAESAALPPPFPTPSAAPAAQPLAPRSAETLTLDDEELHRLGTLTSFDSWLGRVASGHDVGVCILMRSVEQLTEAFNEKYEALCLVSRRRKHATQAARRLCHSSADATSPGRCHGCSRPAHPLCLPRRPLRLRLGSLAPTRRQRPQRPALALGIRRTAGSARLSRHERAGC